MSPSAVTRPTTTWWSPASWTVSSTQSIQVSAPARSGAPDGGGDQSSPANLTVPAEPKAVLMSRWPLASTLTAKCPDAAITGQVREFLLGQNKTSGGSGDRAGEEG